MQLGSHLGRGCCELSFEAWVIEQIAGIKNCHPSAYFEIRRVGGGMADDEAIALYGAVKKMAGDDARQKAASGPC
jgi:hypothetical protein